MYLLPTAELEKQDVSLSILCLLPGGQRWRKHRQLSLLSAPLHDPLAQRSHVQRHDRRPQEVRLQKAKFANMKTKRANVAPHDILLSPRVFCRKPADLHNLAPGTHPPFLTFEGEVKTDVNKIEEFLEETLCPPK